MGEESGLQQVGAFAPEGDIRRIADLENLPPDGAVVRDLDEGIADPDVVVLVGSHETAELHRTGQHALVADGDGFGAEHDLCRAGEIVGIVADADRVSVYVGHDVRTVPVMAQGRKLHSPMKSATNSLQGW